MRDPMLDIIEGDISSLMLEMASLTAPSTRIPSFRCSSLPYCPIRTFLGLSKPKDSYSMDYYTGGGTAIHELVQKWLPRTSRHGRIYAAWKCKSCGTDIKPQLKPRECPSCKADHSHLEHVEVTVSYKGLSGHVDFLYEWSKDQYLLIDFKTTSLLHSRSKNPHNWQDYYPSSPGYVVQIRSYACMLREQYGLNITAMMLLFIDRSRAISSLSDFHPVTASWNVTKHDKWIKKLDKACENNKIVERLNRKIEASSSWNESADNTLNRMIENRPCTSEASWKSWMKRGFYKGECELLDKCLRGPKATKRAVLRMISESG